MKHQAFVNIESKITACKDTKMLEEWKLDKDYPQAFDDVIDSRIKALGGGSSSSSDNSNDDGNDDDGGLVVNK